MTQRSWKKQFWCMAGVLLMAVVCRAGEPSGAACTPVDLSAAANRGFAYDDGKGWTGQCDNDLRTFREKELTCAGLRFSILDPAKNSGKAAVVLAGEYRGDWNREAKLQLPGGKTAALGLLHAVAWAPAKDTEIGEIAVTYADGSAETISVVSGRDCGDWWSSTNRPNGRIAWSRENIFNKVSLFASVFPLKRADAVSAVLRVKCPSTMWMVVGVTVSSVPVAFTPIAEIKTEPYVTAAGKEWAPLEFSREIVKGSPLDFSWVQDAPAGKYGRVKALPDGTLGFAGAPGKRLRLYGVNICFTGNFMEKPEVDKLVATLRRSGYNTVRFHHHDSLLLDEKANDSLAIDKEQLDKFDYLFAKLKENGFYITTDLYTNRLFKPGDAIPECRVYNQRQMMKSVIALSPKALANWKEFARRWMTHVNPYTGIAWGQDPALYMLNLINEDNLTAYWQNNKDPEISKDYQKVFKEWAAKQPAGRKISETRLFKKFLAEFQGAVLDEQLRFCREELRLPVLLTSLNMNTEVELVLNRDKFDVVDNHQYWDHPGFPVKAWNVPHSYNQGCSTAAYAACPRMLMSTRIFGKPFIITEYNFCNPNLYRAEGAPLMGAYAALQNWDAVYRFAWSHSSDGIINPRRAHGFDAVNTPFAQFSDRIAIAMFARGDVKAAPGGVTYKVHKNLFDSRLPLELPEHFTLLGLITKVGSNLETAPANVQGIEYSESKPEVLKNTRVADLWRAGIKGAPVVSETGELCLDPAGRKFAVASPCSASVTLAQGEGKAGEALAVKNADTFQTLAALALDGKALNDSGKILVLHLTNVANSGMRYQDASCRLLEDYGDLPLLVRRGKVEVSLRANAPLKVTALKTDGSALGEIPAKYSAGRVTFTADTAAFPAGVMAYQLSR